MQEQELDLDAIQARADAATKGPWEVTEEIDGVRAGRKTVVRAGKPPLGSGAALRVVTVDQTRPHHDSAPGGLVAELNIAFIAAARTDIPALVAELRETRDLARANGFEAARLSPYEHKVRGWQRRAEELRGWLDEIEQWVETNTTKASYPPALTPADAGWLGAVRQLQELMAKQLRESDERNASTAAHDTLRLHLVSAHRHAGGLDLPDRDAQEQHRNAHNRPGITRDHDEASLHWLPWRVVETITGHTEADR